MARNLLATAGTAKRCLASAATTHDAINMWVRTGIGVAFTSLADGHDASHEN